MLKARILTALVLVPLMVWATFALSTPWLGALMGVFILLAAWEWTALCGMQAPATRIGYMVALAATGVGLYFVDAGLVMLVSVLWWVWALAEILWFKDPRRGGLMTPWGRWVGGFFVLIPAWLAPLWLHQQPGGARLVVFLMALVWVADSAAYFAGKAWGKTKIAPHISPGKSLQGVIGGLVGVAVLAAASAVLVWNLNAERLIIWILIALLAALFSVLGDLTESRAKRIAGVKDSGTILPGHGGILDRIDAFTAAAPLFVVLWIWLRPLS